LSLKIRRAKSADFNKIVHLYGSVGDSPTDPFSNVGRLRKLNQTNLLIAEREGDFAGFLYYVVHRRPWFDLNVEQYAWIQELHVTPKFQGMGIGTALLNNALSRIRRRRISVVYVETGEENKIALHVYRKAGFKDLRKTITLKLNAKTT
jgi:ribosomal protein S18 acetylase RimI-like enzyme